MVAHRHQPVLVGARDHLRSGSAGAVIHQHRHRRLLLSLRSSCHIIDTVIVLQNWPQSLGSSVPDTKFDANLSATRMHLSSSVV